MSLDIITESIVNFTNFIFPFFCGNLAFIMFICIIILIGKILIDRSNKIMHYFGMVIILLTIYPIIMFALNINLIEATCFNFGLSAGTTVDIPGYGSQTLDQDISQTICINFPFTNFSELTGLIFLFTFTLVTVFNSRNIYFDDNTWMFFSCISSAIFGSVLRIIPLYAHTCEGNAVLSLIVVIVILFAGILIFYFSEKFSKNRLK